MKRARMTANRRQQAAAGPVAAAAAFRPGADPPSLPLRSERPEKVLVINCGSSSLKYTLFDTANETHQARGCVDRIGASGTRLVHRGPPGEAKIELPRGDHHQAFAAMLRALTAKDGGVIRRPTEITLVAHRVVHGGDQFAEATVIDDRVLAKIQALSPLAPLHNPVNVIGIQEARRAFPSAPQVAVFDTAFHQTLPPPAFLYGLPYEYYERQGIRRYGFHGTSHAYVCQAAAHYLRRSLETLKIVSCHLGNGASLCAVDHGRSVDTSMGFTPAEGLLMGTRCGDLDSGVVAFLEREEGLDASQIHELLNKRSGMLGLTGLSSDMCEIEAAAARGHRRAVLALSVYCYRLRKYIGAYVAALGGLDTLIFTGGVGQGSAYVRAETLQGLRCLGIQLDGRRNREARGHHEICRLSTAESPVTILIVPTHEEQMIACEALRALSRAPALRRRKTRR